MPFRVSENDGLVEVHAWGDVSMAEVCMVLRELRQRDPHKERSDIWYISDASVIPIAAYAAIVEELKSMCGPETGASRSAIVVSNELQRAAMEIYKAEAVGLPWQIGVFRSRDEAVAWLRAGEGMQVQVAGNLGA
jgi:predicted Fe-S protein YdhL (DUF1289 family)